MRNRAIFLWLLACGAAIQVDALAHAYLHNGTGSSVSFQWQIDWTGDGSVDYSGNGSCSANSTTSGYDQGTAYYRVYIGGQYSGWVFIQYPNGSHTFEYPLESNPDWKIPINFNNDTPFWKHFRVYDEDGNLLDDFWLAPGDSTTKTYTFDGTATNDHTITVKGEARGPDGDYWYEDSEYPPGNPNWYQDGGSATGGGNAGGSPLPGHPTGAGTNAVNGDVFPTLEGPTNTFGGDWAKETTLRGLVNMEYKALGNIQYALADVLMDTGKMVDLQELTVNGVATLASNVVAQTVAINAMAGGINTISNRMGIVTNQLRELAVIQTTNMMPLGLIVTNTYNTFTNISRLADLIKGMSNIVNVTNNWTNSPDPGWTNIDGMKIQIGVMASALTNEFADTPGFRLTVASNLSTMIDVLQNSITNTPPETTNQIASDTLEQILTNLAGLRSDYSTGLSNSLGSWTNLAGRVDNVNNTLSNGVERIASMMGILTNMSTNTYDTNFIAKVRQYIEDVRTNQTYDGARLITETNGALTGKKPSGEEWMTMTDARVAVGGGIENRGANIGEDWELPDSQSSVWVLKMPLPNGQVDLDLNPRSSARITALRDFLYALLTWLIVATVYWKFHCEIRDQVMIAPLARQATSAAAAPGVSAGLAIAAGIVITAAVVALPLAGWAIYDTWSFAGPGTAMMTNTPLLWAASYGGPLIYEGVALINWFLPVTTAVLAWGWFIWARGGLMACYLVYTTTVRMCTG